MRDEPETITIEAGDETRLTPRRPERPAGPWREHEREMAMSLNLCEEEVEVLPPEAFDDDEPTPEERKRLLDGRETPDPRNSTNVFFLMASCCSGWKRRPKPRELYDAIRTEKPTNRDRSLIRFWTTEPTPFDLITAWAEGVYTLRQLVGAMHRTGNATTCRARFLNRLAAHPDMRPSK